MSLLNFNEGKNTIIKIDGIYYARFPIKTHVITEQDNIADIVDRYVSKHIEKMIYCLFLKSLLLVVKVEQFL